MITAHIDGSRVVVDAAPPMPAPATEIPLAGIRCVPLADGRVRMVDANGNGLGQFTNQRLAESTIQFLSR